MDCRPCIVKFEKFSEVFKRGLIFGDKEIDRLFIRFAILIEEHLNSLLKLQIEWYFQLYCDDLEGKTLYYFFHL
jgi:hypothetical protein